MNCTCKDCLYIPPYNVLNYIGNEQNFNPTYPHDWTDPTININNIESNNQKMLGRILVLSDAAHSFGAFYRTKHTGALTDVSVFSFHELEVDAAQSEATTRWSRSLAENRQDHACRLGRGLPFRFFHDSSWNIVDPTYGGLKADRLGTID